MINAASFSYCTNLIHLALDFNDLVEIPDHTFFNLNHLQFLDVGFNFISSLSSNSFNGLISIIDMRFDFNSISELPVNLFSRMSDVFRIDLAFNQLTTINASSFDAVTLQSFRSFQADSNNIDAIDSNWFESAEQLNALVLLSNVCINGQFNNLINDRQAARDALNGCFENFGGEIATTTTTTTEMTTTMTPPVGTVS